MFYSPVDVTTDTTTDDPDEFQNVYLRILKYNVLIFCEKIVCTHKEITLN